jgi:ubiquinol-cytochrome c reductase iron-sulfur subunit
MEREIDMNQTITHDNKAATPTANLPRRRFLTIATTVVGALGVGAVSVPFIKSWLPSERAKVAGAPVQFDISKLEPGRQVTIEWRSKPVFILRRTPEILQRLKQPSHLQRLRDPDSEVASQQPLYTVNAVRSIRDETFIVIGICTHLGCIPTFRPDVAPEDLGPEWIGGYFCPCHSSRFDLAGRVFKGVPAPTNLVVPPYRYLTDSIIEIGVDT